jgi:hypothetical protein
MTKAIGGNTKGEPGGTEEHGTLHRLASSFWLSMRGFSTFGESDAAFGVGAWLDRRFGELKARAFAQRFSIIPRFDSGWGIWLWVFVGSALALAPPNKCVHAFDLISSD